MNRPLMSNNQPHSRMSMLTMARRMPACSTWSWKRHLEGTLHRRLPCSRQRRQPPTPEKKLAPTPPKQHQPLGGAVRSPTQGRFPEATRRRLSLRRCLGPCRPKHRQLRCATPAPPNRLASPGLSRTTATSGLSGHTAGDSPPLASTARQWTMGRCGAPIRIDPSGHGGHHPRNSHDPTQQTEMAQGSSSDAWASQYVATYAHAPLAYTTCCCATGASMRHLNSSGNFATMATAGGRQPYRTMLLHTGHAHKASHYDRRAPASMFNTLACPRSLLRNLALCLSTTSACFQRFAYPGTIPHGPRQATFWHHKLPRVVLCRLHKICAKSGPGVPNTPFLARTRVGASCISRRLT